MAYDPAVIRAIKRIGRKRGVGREAILGALATGIVESGLRNLGHGDADSVNWRQERASIYGGDMSLKNSVNRFYDEWQQHDKPGFNPGLTAANVQRPREDLRGRYAQELDKAKQILGGKFDAGPGEASVGSPVVSSQPSEQPNIFATMGALQLPYSQDNPVQQQLQQGWNLLSQLQDRKAGASTPPSVSPAGTGGGAEAPDSGNGSQLYELFHGKDAWKNGQRIGAIPGHDDHLHAAADKRRIQWIARQAQKRELNVRELRGFDPVDPVHADKSHHYRDEAADISGDPGQLEDFERWLRRKYF